MRKRNLLGALLATTLLFGFGTGCRSDLVKKVEGLADEACACKDTACTRKVNRKIKRALNSAKKPSQSEARQLMAAAMRASECTAKLEPEEE